MEMNDEICAEPVDLDAAANDLFDAWLEERVTWNDFLYDHAVPLKSPHKKTNLSTRRSKGPKFVDIVMRFDVLKYFREIGKHKFPTITMLAKVIFQVC